MKSKLLAQLMIAALLGASIPAFAQPHDNQHHSDWSAPGPKQHDMRPPPVHGHGPMPQEAYRGRPGGPMPHADWRQGDRLPSEYRNHNYVVDDWRGHGLRPPPHGYHWVGVNGDYVLAAIATGIIADVLFSSH
ncbi:RcnB family protein [Paraburkholderia youngii]|uniref:RcnB family protein n=1 Tax=Paraburkholderia youngii TaxID=2782701 RepID=UPI003D1A0362